MTYDVVKVEGTEDGKIGVWSTFRDKENVKEVPGALWDKDRRIWTTPLSWAACVQLRGVFGERLRIGPWLSWWADQEYRNRVYPAMLLRVAEDCPDVAEWCKHSNGTDELSPLQRSAAAFMVAAGGAVEGDPMGSGKTPTIISALRIARERDGRDVFPALVVCGNNAKWHWRDEFAAWDASVDVAVVDGNIKARRAVLAEEHDVYVINYESMIKHTRLAGYGSIRLKDEEKEDKELNTRTFNALIVDEVHRAKDPKAKQTRGLYRIADTTAEAGGLLWGATGSLVANTPVDLWSPMRSVAPHEYPGRVAFIDRYALLNWNTFGSMTVVGLRGETRDELFKFLDPRFIRRPKQVILPELKGKLPPVIRMVNLPTRQRKAYDQFRKEMLVELEGGVLMAKNPMTKVLRLRQLAGATGTINEEGKIELAAPSAKVDDLVATMEELQGESVVVYAESRQLTELAHARLVKEGFAAGLFTGGNVDEREALRRQFQDSELQVLLLTYGAGAESINLSRADAVVRLEFSWSSVKNSQGMDRPDRLRTAEMPEREVPLRVVDIVAADTVDEYVRDKYADKLDMLEEVVRDEETLKLWLSR